MGDIAHPGLIVFQVCKCCGGIRTLTSTPTAIGTCTFCSTEGARMICTSDKAEADALSIFIKHNSSFLARKKEEAAEKKAKASKAKRTGKYMASRNGASA